MAMAVHINRRPYLRHKHSNLPFRNFNNRFLLSSLLNSSSRQFNSFTIKMAIQSQPCPWSTMPMAISSHSIPPTKQLYLLHFHRHNQRRNNNNPREEPPPLRQEYPHSTHPSPNRRSHPKPSNPAPTTTNP